jgi:hypothetical protein
LTKFEDQSVLDALLEDGPVPEATSEDDVAAGQDGRNVLKAKTFEDAAKLVVGHVRATQRKSPEGRGEQ